MDDKKNREEAGWTQVKSNEETQNKTSGLSPSVDDLYTASDLCSLTFAFSFRLNWCKMLHKVCYTSWYLREVIVLHCLLCVFFYGKF